MIVNYAPDPIENCRRINNVIQAYRNAHTPAATPGAQKE
jgi:hypothetical protein